MPQTPEIHDAEPQRLLVTKLAPPQIRQDLVNRPRLLSLLDQGSERKLTLISTGPGYGKSTLAAAWLATCRMPAAWLSLDEGDNDPYTLFSCLAAALQTLDPELGAGLRQALSGVRVPPVRSLVATLINELAVVTRPFVLVLDDLHSIRSPEILEGFALLVQNLPGMMRLLVTTRTDPPLPLLRMQARGELLEVRGGDISFTIDETRALLGDRYGLTLRDHELQEIQAWSEGWPVGLMLVGQRMQAQNTEERRALLERLDGDMRFVQDYLWQETIEQQSPERRRFLLQTAILERFDAGLCAEVTGLPQVGAMLRQIEQDNLFLIGFEGAGRWFRYHHLFADALRHRLTQEYTPDEVRALHRKAAGWLLERGTSEEAARHAMAAQDWEIALPLLDRICAELIAQDRVSSLREWLEAVPRDVLQRQPRLCTWLAWALARHGTVPAALQLLESPHRTWTPEEQNAAQVLILQIQMLQAIFDQRADDGLAIVQRGIDLLAVEQPVDRGRFLIGRALLQGAQGDVDGADRTLKALRDLAPVHGSPTLRLMEANTTAVILLMRGRLGEAAENLRRVIAAGDEWKDVVVQYAHWQLASIHLEWNELDEAERILKNGYQIGVKTGAALHRTRYHQFFAELAWARNDADLAFEEVERAIEAAIVIASTAEIRYAAARRARFWLASGQLERVRSWARESELDAPVDPPLNRLSEYLVLLRLMVIDGRAERALDAIEQVQRNAARAGRIHDVLELLLLRAIAEQALGHGVAAERSLQQALKIAVPERYTRTFIDHGQLLVPVLERVARSDDPNAGTARSLLETMGFATERGPSVANLLSPRETEVLTLIAAGESNREIGDHLFISEQTVKKHVSNIFDKLSVASRTQAIDRARRLGIL